MPNKKEHRTIDASPTKDFFISILVRDIKLTDAICDLVDNSVDGARRLRPNGDFHGLHVSIEVNNQNFVIADNCGGIDVETAINYAFRFGRPKDMQPTKHSVGQFGVGMKRALFKMGRDFEIESKSANSFFLLQVDVEEWKSEKNLDDQGKEKWEFEFKEVDESVNNPPENCLTIIRVSNLYESIAREFTLKNFENRLIEAIEAAHQESISAGLEISVNEHNLKYTQPMLLQSDLLKPFLLERTIQYTDEDLISVRIYSGIGKSDYKESGWYIFCNGRLVIKADKTPLTGWGYKEAEADVPKAHPQYARFFGFVFFDSDNAGLLPWNTSKNGIDSESPLYQAVRLDMISGMRQVIDFLNALDAELDTDSTFLKENIDRAKPIRFSEIQPLNVFAYPSITSQAAPKPKESRISYTKPIELVEEAKRLINAKNNKELGEKTFDYYLNMEGG
ncbi:ATP-binding protein [Methylocaldum gracile]